MRSCMQRVASKSLLMVETGPRLRGAVMVDSGRFKQQRDLLTGQ